MSAATVLRVMPKEKTNVQPRRMERRSTYTFGLTHDYMERLLELENAERRRGGAFSFQGAVVSVWLNMDRGITKSMREYGDIWGWGRSRVHRMWGEILGEIADLRSSFGRFVDPPDTHYVRRDDLPEKPADSETVVRQSRDSRETENADSVEKPADSETVVRQSRDSRETHIKTDLQTSNLQEDSFSSPSAPPKRVSKPKIHPIAETIYAAYPRKVGKDKALKSITSAIASGRDPTALLEAVQAYAAYWATRLEHEPHERQYIPHPATWFNQGRYDDDRTEWQYRPPTMTQGVPRAHEPVPTRRIV